MKKTLKRFLVALLTAVMVLSSLSISALAEDEGYTLFIAFGGDAAESGDWGLGYAGPGSDVAGDITATTETIKVGETKTVSLTLASECVYTWYLAPVLVAENIGLVDATVKCSIDGTDVTDSIDFAAGDAWWYEGTGAFTKDQAIRLAGGYNEWGAHYMESPKFTTIEYTITLNDIKTTDEVGDSNLVESTETYDAFLAFGGDAAESGDWGLGYYGPDNVGNTEGITATNGTITSGGTTTLSLEFENPVVYTWFVRPVIAATGVGAADFSVKVFLDDQEVAIDLAAGDNWWSEDTGDYTEANGNKPVCVGGGYNEWGTKYMAESPTGFKKITFEITANSIMLGGAEEEPDVPQSNAGPVDLDGTYHAYLGFQTPKYSFRNAFDDATYGRDVESDTDWFHQVTGWDESNNALTLPGTFVDAEIKGNGTYTVSVSGLAFPEGEFASQEYMNLLFLSTDIPNTGEITISDIVLKVDGKSVDMSEGGPIVSPDSVNYLNMLLQNIWNDEVGELGYYPVPMKEISITFTVSGFNYSNEPTDEVVTTPTPDAGEDKTDKAPTTAPSKDASTTEKKDGGNTVVIVVVIAVIAVIAGVAGVVIAKKKK